jgi:hypothetical protein
MLPKSPEVRPSEDDLRYGITIGTSLLAGQEDLLGKMSIRDKKVNVGSRFRPQIALRNSLGEMSTGIYAAEYLERTFHDLHWIGLTPDRVVRYIPKRRYVQPFDYKIREHGGGRRFTGLRLVAVEMNVHDIDTSLRALSEAYRQEEEARFGA